MFSIPVQNIQLAGQILSGFTIILKKNFNIRNAYIAKLMLAILTDIELSLPYYITLVSWLHNDHPPISTAKPECDYF